MLLLTYSKHFCLAIKLQVSNFKQIKSLKNTNKRDTLKVTKIKRRSPYKVEALTVVNKNKHKSVSACKNTII